MKIEIEIDPAKHGLAPVPGFDEALKYLEEIYGILWCEAYYDPSTEKLREFCQPLEALMSKANKILRFKK